MYGVETDGNAEQDPYGEFVGENILYVAHTFDEAASHFELSRSEVTSLLEGARKKLFIAREERPHPHLDDKILLSWNGFMISAYANAYRILGDDRYRAAAERTVRFLYEKLGHDESGSFKRRYRDGEARYDAHLEDYASLTHGLLDLYGATDERAWVDRAGDLAGEMIDRFYDTDRGGFFATSGEDESILVRSKE